MRNKHRAAPLNSHSKVVYDMLKINSYLVFDIVTFSFRLALRCMGTTIKTNQWKQEGYGICIMQWQWQHTQKYNLVKSSTSHLLSEKFMHNKAVMCKFG